MVHLQEMHERHAAQGLVVLGFNWADAPEFALGMMREKGATYPTVLDNSEQAAETWWEAYRLNCVPASYIIDRDGLVADAWPGDEPTRAAAVLQRLGIGPDR